MKFKIILLTFIITLVNSFGYSQYVNKKAGVCFRVDDNQTSQKWIDYANIFNNYGFKFGFCLNLALIDPADTLYINTIRNLISQGHELIDHTPNHNTTFFTVRNFSDTVFFNNNPGVDHINQKKICLKIDSITTNSFNDEGLINISGNQVISVSPGEFSNFSSSGKPVNNIYIPSLNKIFTYKNLKNFNSNDPDTLYLLSFWYEDNVNFTMTQAQYKKLGIYDIHLNREGITLLMLQTKKYCDEFGFQYPNTWAQPGGLWPYFKADEIIDAFNNAGYTSSGLKSSGYLNFFNQNKLDSKRRYFFGGFDFNTEVETFKSIKSKIAKNIALNYVSVEINHFGGYYPLVGGWNSYMSRVDSLLSWCKLNNIPVGNYKYWTKILFDSITNPYENIFPKLNVDLDNDSFPDGYNKIYIGNIQDSGGVSSSNGYLINRNTTGYFCSISGLGGVEKGTNLLEFYTQGGAINDSLYVKIIFYPTNNFIIFSTPINSNIWNKNKIFFDCPDTIDYITIQFYLKKNSNNSSKLSGMSLRKKSEFNIDKYNFIKYKRWEKIRKVNLKNLVKEPYYSSEQLQFSFIKSNSLNCSIDTAGFLSFNKPNPFWNRTDTVFIKVSNPDEHIDTLRIIIEPCTNEICYQDTLYLEADLTSTPISLNLNSNPFDSTITYLNNYTFKSSPKVDTWYLFNAVLPNNDTVIDSIFVKVNSPITPSISVSGINPYCKNDSVLLKIQSSPEFVNEWYYNDIILLQNGKIDSIFFNGEGKISVIQTNEIGCKNKSNDIILSYIPDIQFSRSSDTLVCANVDSIVLNYIALNSDTVFFSSSGSGILKAKDGMLSYMPSSADKSVGYTKINIEVVGINSCETLTDSIKIFYKPLPDKPYFISGDTVICKGINSSTYELTAPNPNSSHLWNIQPAGQISSYAYSSQFLISWNNSPVGLYKLFVKDSNECGFGPASDTFYIKIIDTPDKPVFGSYTDSIICQNTPVSLYPVVNNYNTLGYIWFIEPSNAANILFENNTAKVNWTGQYYGQVGISTRSYNLCGLSPISDTINVNILPLPSDPLIINGINTIDLTYFPVSEFVAQSTYADSLIWRIFPESVGNLYYYDSICFITWNQSGMPAGNCQLFVQALNNCGFSPNYTIFNINTFYSSPSQINLQNNNNTYKVIPNPSSSGYFNIINSSGRVINKIQIFDTFGREIKPENIEKNGELIKINLSSFSKGVYYLKTDNIVSKIIYN